MTHSPSEHHHPLDPAHTGQPLLVFDGDCGFCRHWIERWKLVTGDRVAYAPYQDVAASFPRIPRHAFAESVQLLEPDGRVTSGAEAVFRSLAEAEGYSLGLWCYRHLPGFAPVAEASYGVVAANRPLFSRLTRLLFGGVRGVPAVQRVRRLFLHLLGLVFLIAFASLWVQIEGLAGENGILPAQELLEVAEAQLGAERFLRLPSLAWLGAGDAALHAFCASGVVAALFLAAGRLPGPALVACWALYLSLAGVCRDFLWYQWDALLLEAGLLALPLAPWRWHPRWPRVTATTHIGLWLERLLLFKLMFLSGVVKLASGDRTWADLTALAHHYETQPLPTPLAWYAHHLPLALHQAVTASMFAIELGVVFLVLSPRRPRALAFWPLVALQAGIAVTGNYTFFNLLAVALCLALLDDAMLPGWLRGGQPVELTPVGAGRVGGRWRAAPVFAALAAYVLVSSVQIADRAGTELPWAETGHAWERNLAPWRSINGYGLFAVMTTRRPEIIVEGSNDGEDWRAYAFKYKPGDPARRPPIVAPHQPRLDWQMWFAALGRYQQTPWFARFCQRLLEGSPPVLDLLAENPFPDAPPRYVRAILYDYRFSDPEMRRDQGVWWQRRRGRHYSPVLSLPPDTR